MKQTDTDILARVLRNQQQIPHQYRLEMIRAVEKAFRNKYQFFNSKRFLAMASLTTDENIRNDINITTKSVRDWWK